MPRLTVTLLLGALTFSATCATATAQSLQTWDTKSRERSQRLHSAAVSALEKGQTAQAVSLLNQSTAADQSDAVAFSTLGVALAKEGKYDEALESLQKAYKLGHSAETLLTTGMVYYLQHDYPAAIKTWNKALEVDRKLTPVYGDLGFAYMRSGDFSAAEDSFRRLIKARPNSQLAYRGLALTKYLAGEIGAAVKAADHARSLAASWQPVILLQAKLDFLQGYGEQGKQRVRDLLAVAGKKKAVPFSMTILGYPVQHDFHWDVLSADHFDNGNLLLARTRSLPREDSLRRSYANKGKVSAVLPLVRGASEGAPEDFFLLRELALLELSDGQYAAAAEDFAKVLQLCPSCRVDWLHLAKAQSLAGKDAEASYAAKEYFRQLPGEQVSAAFKRLVESAPAEGKATEPQTEKDRPPGQFGSGF